MSELAKAGSDERQESILNQAEALAAAGAKLRDLCERSGFSQENLSLEVNVDQSSLSKVERIGPHLFGWQKLLNVADAVGCIVKIDFQPKGEPGGPLGYPVTKNLMGPGGFAAVPTPHLIRP